MPLSLASLNSGSNANCYYVGNEQDAVLVDAGLSYKETMKRMEALQLDAGKLRGIFISHEHTDHINGLTQLHRKLSLPVFISQKTMRNMVIRFQEDLVRHFTADEWIDFGSLRVLPFAKHHDAADPFSFMVSGHGVNIGVITDIGHACRDVINCFRQCDAAFLESNYCEDMLANGSYPAVLKKRISGKKGHLSNKQALELFLKHRSPNLQLLLLSHLSENNNTPEKALSVFRQHAGKVKVVVADRHKASEVFTIHPAATPANSTPKSLSQMSKQLTLFS